MDKASIFGSQKHEKKSLRRNNFLPQKRYKSIDQFAKNDKGSRLFDKSL